MQRLLIIQCVCLLCWCSTKSAVGIPKKRKEEDESRVQLGHHSFAVPLSYEAVLDDWVISGASLAERERLLLHPGVPERAAFVWNKWKLLTNNFEVIIHFRVNGTKDPEQLSPDQSFAFWYVYDNITEQFNESTLIHAKSWKEGMDAADMTLIGAKARFNGFGAVLSMRDTLYKKVRPVVSGIWNDGSKSLKYNKDVPIYDSKQLDFRNTLNPAQMKIRFSPTSIEGHLKQSPSLSWNECFKLDRNDGRVNPGGYIGFSAWSGAKSEQTVSDLVSIVQLEVYNHDSTSLGEEIKDVSSEIQEAYRQMLTDENRHFIDQKSQTDHLKRLQSLLSEHAESSKPAETKMFQDLEDLQDRVGRLGEDCKTLTREVQVLVGSRGESGTSLRTMKDEVVGLRQAILKDRAHEFKTYDTLRGDVKAVGRKHEEQSSPEAFAKVTGHISDVQMHVQSSSSTMVRIIWAMIGVAAIIALLMWHWMSVYEKKHFF